MGLFLSIGSRRVDVNAGVYFGVNIGQPLARSDEESTEDQVKFFRVKELGAMRGIRKIAGPRHLYYRTQNRDNSFVMFGTVVYSS